MLHLETITKAGCTARLADDGKVVVSGLDSLSPAMADGMRHFIRDNKQAIVLELMAGDVGAEVTDTGLTFNPPLKSEALEPLRWRQAVELCDAWTAYHKKTA